jgi:hypothetical protein
MSKREIKGHERHSINRLLGCIPAAVQFRYLTAAGMYDSADDGPETGLIRAFRAFPEGSYSRDYWRHVRDSSL